MANNSSIMYGEDLDQVNLLGNCVTGIAWLHYCLVAALLLSYVMASFDTDINQLEATYLVIVPLLDSEETLEFGEEDVPKGRLKHPVVTAFHLIFRTSALVVYELCGIFSSGFIGPFIVIVLLLSLDFWTVKNITGRLMVGLRWWNYIDDEGQSHWVFEAKKGGLQGRVSKTEVRVFWVALVAFPLFWSIIFLIAVLLREFQWAIVVLIAITLTGSNLYGYVRCKLGKSESITQSFKNMASGLVQRQMVSNVANMFTRAPPTTTPSSTV